MKKIFFTVFGSESSVTVSNMTEEGVAQRILGRAANVYREKHKSSLPGSFKVRLRFGKRSSVYQLRKNSPGGQQGVLQRAIKKMLEPPKKKGDRHVPRYGTGHVRRSVAA